MTCKVTFLPANRTIDVPEGATLADAAKRAGLFLDAPCGGNGTCGKCAVEFAADGETKRVLACQTLVPRECTVVLPEESHVRTLGEGAARRVPFAPYPDAKASLPGACMAAFDLGTTTIVCYLLDAKTGEQLCVRGAPNPQSAFGADVIARSSHALKYGYAPLRETALYALNALLASACKSSSRTTEQVVLASIVGNTVMVHLLLEYPVDSLVRAPYVPYRSERQILSAKEVGLTAHETCAVLIPPVVGGFVGADTVSCLSATAFDEITEATLLLDVGTNGELALTNGSRRVSCSTAAGPAFEGANISCGMRASAGAIERVWMENGELQFSTIGNAPPLGVCGSGLIDLAALLNREDVIEEGGRLAANGSLGGRVATAEDGQPAFRLAERADGTPILLSQKDVRELQLGKAAMRAGVETLLKILSLKSTQIQRTLLAGAFGSHLSPAALCGIGLLPPELEPTVESVGNAAGEGAKLYLLNYELFLQTSPLAKETEYIELTVYPGFSERYVDAMFFPKDDE